MKIATNSWSDGGDGGLDPRGEEWGRDWKMETSQNKRDVNVDNDRVKEWEHKSDGNRTLAQIVITSIQSSPY